MFRARLDQKYQFGPFFLTIDHRRSEFGAPCDKAYFCSQTLLTAVAADADGLAVFDFRQYGLWCEKPEFEVAWWQQCHDRTSCGYSLTRAVIDLLNRGFAGTIGIATREPRLRPLQIGL